MGRCARKRRCGTRPLGRVSDAGRPFLGCGARRCLGRRNRRAPALGIGLLAQSPLRVASARYLCRQYAGRPSLRARTRLDGRFARAPARRAAFRHYRVPRRPDDLFHIFRRSVLAYQFGRNPARCGACFPSYRSEPYGDVARFSSLEAFSLTLG